MKKIIVFNMITVDGYFAGINGDISWHRVDAEFNEFAIKQLGEVGTLIFGRVTYEMMAGYWPGSERVKDDPIVAGLMNNANKIVFSKSLGEATWNNTILMKDIRKLDIEKLKADAEKDIFIFGSGEIVKEFTKLGLVDEYRFIIAPVALGSGRTLFDEKLELKLTNSKVFANGNVLVCYETIK